MARLIAQFDWASTPLGAMDTWTSLLASYVNLILCSRQPAALAWGDELTMIYNDAVIPTLGDKHPALGRSYRDVFAEAWAQVQPEMDGCLYRGETSVQENNLVPLMLQGGQTENKYFTYSFVPVYDQGRIVGVLNAFQDTTEAVVSARQLKASETRSDRILQSIGDGVIVTDADLRVIRMNDVAQTLCGWSETDAVGKPLPEVFRIINETTRQTAEDPAAKVKRLNKIVGLANHTILIAKDGTELHIGDSGAPIRDEADNLTGVVLVFRDVSEQRRIEIERRMSFQELQAAHTTVQLAMEFAEQGAWVFDEGTGLVTVDNVVRELHDLPGLEEPAEYWITTIHPEDQAHVIAAFAESRTGEKPFNVEYRTVRSDGMRWIESRGRLLSQPGDPVVITGVMADVSVRKQQTDMLRQTEKLAAVGRLAASIAHEINNPLESVTNLLYLARTSQNMVEVQDYLDTAERELRRVSVISNQTLRFYKQSTAPKPVTCNDLFESVLSIYQGRIVNSRIEVEKRKRAERSFECFDGEIRQVLNNLVGNAIDAMHPQGGRLLLRSHEATNWHTGQKGVTLTVADTGSGMTSTVLRKLFEAFYTTKGIGGTGLGLWVSKEIVDRHHGSLRVRSSQAEGHSGSVFSLFLPYEAARR